MVHSVRKHPAPQGALRPQGHRPLLSAVPVRKHPAPQGALRLTPDRAIMVSPSRQKAPSTTRCIKTLGPRCRSRLQRLVRKHPAPQGALRHLTVKERHVGLVVRKHPAPQGALRRHQSSSPSCSSRCQKAPSTTRCIKTSHR